jgi:GNAT superfamily N-acetyltransferase
LILRVEPLDRSHDRSQFLSGDDTLDEWFRQKAGQDERRNLARVFVAIDSALGIVGFYSLSSFKLELTELPDEISRKLPRYDGVPAALIGRLVRDVRVKGQGIGKFLVVDALQRVLGAAKALAVFAIVVDAKDTSAGTFYQRIGFRPFPLRPLRLFILASSAANALDQSRSPGP